MFSIAVGMPGLVITFMLVKIKFNCESDDVREMDT